MKRSVLLLAALSLLGVSSPARSQVTLLIHKIGCLTLKPLAPTHFSIAAPVGTGDQHTIIDRVVAPPQSIILPLKPGYYIASISSPRCWATRQMFVVGSGWNRTITVNAGITLGPPRRNEEEFVDVLYIPSSGLVVHTQANVSKVFVKAENGDVVKADHHGNVWYLDYAPVGQVRIRLYAGTHVVGTDDVMLQHNGFLEKFYRH